MKVKREKYDVGVIIGRFQVPELHEGHKALINSVIEHHQRVLILLGVSSTLGTKDNPLDFTSRLGLFDDLIEDHPNVVIQPILDVSTNEEWSRNVDKTIRTNYPIGSVCLYGGRGSFIESYQGAFDAAELEIISNTEGTLERKITGKQIKNSPEFRAGQIYYSQNQFPKVFPTVDMAVVNDNNEVVMGIKVSSDGKYVFPGGFVDTTDKDLEAAAYRELNEEIGGIDEIYEIKYIGSFLVDDWRYQGDTEKIMTTLFRIKHKWGGPRAREELSDVKYIPIEEKSLRLVVDYHRPLFEALIEFEKEK